MEHGAALPGCLYVTAKATFCRLSNAKVTTGLSLATRNLKILITVDKFDSKEDAHCYLTICEYVTGSVWHRFKW